MSSIEDNNNQKCPMCGQNGIEMTGISGILLLMRNFRVVGVIELLNVEGVA
jgi:hypothetical protein